MLSGLVVICSSAEAQQPTKVPRIGFVAGPGDASKPGLYVEAFRRGLRDLGYIEGKNILVEYRYAEGKVDLAPGLVAELVQLKVDVLVAGFLIAIRAAKQATTTMPVVMITNVDPVATGLVDSLSHPGGNITGITLLMRDLSGKRLELLKEVAPRMSSVGVLWDAEAPAPALAFKEYEAAARTLKVHIQSLEVRGSNPDLENSFPTAGTGRTDALITITNPRLSRLAKSIAELAIRNGQPSMSERSDYVEAGGLVSYAASTVESHRRAAYFVDRILKGAKPADLPVEQPTKFEMVINLKTAKQIGLTIPPNVLARADRVIK
jgi:putative ABC transport system substrate-binding protein